MNLHARIPPRRALLGAAALLVLAACSSGGPATVVNQPTSSGATGQSYTGPAPQNADVQAFQINFWNNVRVGNRCGGCHHEGGQSPMFARSDDVNLAYQAALPLVNLSNPAQSTFVVKVGRGHNCWLADPQACADTLLTWIQNWIGGAAASTTSIALVPPPPQPVGTSKLFPADSSAFQQYLWTPILRQFCVGCHRPDSSTPQTPYFASSDPTQAYLAAQTKINLNTPNQSRFYQRLAEDFHHCWPTPSSGGAPDCPGSAAAMLAALNAYAGTITPTPVDPALVLSQQLRLDQGTIASGGSRYDGAVIAKYEFKTGTGSIAYDTSGVSPAADLTLSGGNCWVQGWGITLGMGANACSKAQASTSSSAKLASLIGGTGEFSIEVWAAPNNVAQKNAWIVSYSGSDTTRNVTLGQTMQQYQGQTRSSSTDTNGMPALFTSKTGNFAQAALQHVVLTYDPVNGQKIYVNGKDTGDVDPSKGGTFARWDNTFALVLGSETTGKEAWAGVIKFAAVHNRALTPAQIQQNFAAGVGERFYLLFDVSALSGMPQSYIVVLASQYDNYSYLFTQPRFLTLSKTATVPANLVIAGMRVGMNGSILSVGQAWSTLNVTVGGAAYSPANGQLLSMVGSVFAADKGAGQDMFFLSFDQFGSKTHVYTEPVVPVVPVPPNNAAQPDMGVKLFAQVNAAMSTITGVPVTNPAVGGAAGAFTTSQQSLPATNNIAAFLSANQAAVAGLASTYCAQLVSSNPGFFGATVAANLSANASGFFSVAGNRSAVITPLVNAAVGQNVNPQTAAAAQTELDALLQRFTASPPANQPALSGNVATATQAACSALLGSAAVTVQ